MITLGLELSTEIGSLALLDGADVIADTVWTEGRSCRQHLFAAIDEAVRRGAVKFNQVSLLAVGIGPGSFSGLRMSISAARGLAMPANMPVRGVSSAAALAWQVMEDFRHDTVCVWGDARGGDIWRGTFRREGNSLRREAAWQVSRGEFPPVGRAIWVTADWARIGERLQQWRGPETELVEKPMTPHAGAVARIAAAAHEAGETPEPLAPIYLHPAVAPVPS